MSAARPPRGSGAGRGAGDAELLRPFRPMLWLVAAAVFMQMLDTTIVNTALPSMAVDLGQSPLRMQSVVVAYALTVAMLIPASGWLADRLGTRRLFLVAIVVFTLGSLACALAQSLDTLVAARVLQGVGGSMLLPVGRLAVLRSVPRQDFLAAMTFVTVPGLVGPLIGPSLGGWLVQVASWHWIFLINVPLGVAGAFAAMRLMPDLRAPVAHFDGVGYALLAFGMIAVSVSVDALAGETPRRGAIVVLLLAGLMALVAYWLHAARTKAPLFPLALFRVRTYAVGVLGNLFSRLGSGGMPYLIPLLLQVALGYPPAQAGMMMIPVVLAGMFSKRIVVPLVHRFGYRRVLVVNTVLTGAGMASFGFIGPGQPLWLLIVQFACFGAVNSLQFTAMNTLTLRDLGGEQASAGNSLLSMVMMLAMSLGVATAGGLLAAFSADAGAQGTAPVLAAFRWTFVCIGVVTAASAAIFAQIGNTRRIPDQVVETTEQR